MNWNEGWNKTEVRNMPQAIHKLFHAPTYSDELLKECIMKLIVKHDKSFLLVEKPEFILR
jgi:hypothetical protein